MPTSEENPQGIAEAGALLEKPGPYSRSRGPTREAGALLENRGLRRNPTNPVGKLIEKGFELLPARWRDKVKAPHEGQ